MFALADCNNFYASCERVFRPDLNGKPVIVLSNNDGCTVSRSNEAKAVGIKMGDPLFKIRDLVEQHGVSVFSSNYALYGDMSRRVQEVLGTYAPMVEQYSIDEAFLDLRGVRVEDFGAYARTVSAACRKLTGIPVSVGVAPTKTLAKIASKLCKQYPKLQGGCYMYRPADIEKVLRKFPVEDVWGVGRRSVKKLASLHVTTAWDLVQRPETDIRRRFALPMWRTWKELHGVPCIGFEDCLEPRQTICVSRSFAHEVTDVADLCSQTTTFAAGAVEKLRAQHSLALELAVFAMTNRFREDQPQTFASRLVVFPDGSDDHKTLVVAAAEATRALFSPRYGYKKAGVVITRLAPREGFTRSLFRDADADQRDERLSQALDGITAAYGPGTVRFGVQGDGIVRMSSEHQSPHFTTRWSDIPGVQVK